MREQAVFSNLLQQRLELDRSDVHSNFFVACFDIELAVEGWIVIVSGIHEEAQEDDLRSSPLGDHEIKDLHFNLDRRTGLAKVIGTDFIL